MTGSLSFILWVEATKVIDMCWPNTDSQLLLYMGDDVTPARTKPRRATIDLGKAIDGP